MKTPRALSFAAEGEPISKARPRVTKNGTFTPKKTLEAEAAIRAAFLKAHPDALRSVDADHAWSLSVKFFRYERRARDLDNLVKTVQDALQGLIWADDAQVEHYRDMETVWVDTPSLAGIFVHAIRLYREPRPPRSEK